MDDPSHPPIPWPGLRAGQAFVLPLQAGRMATPFGECFEADGVRLRPKAEFHVTVLSRDMARLAAGLGEAALRTLYEALSWMPRRTGRYALLRSVKPAEDGTLECWSLIEHLDLPAMIDFRAGLARNLGPAFAAPVPHVTHFVHGDPHGIGVPDARALAALQVREVTP